LGDIASDAGKYYRNRTDKMKILKCAESIPAQLASDRRKFQFVDIEKKKGSSRRYGDALEWLVTAGIAYRCYNLTDIDLPLSENLMEAMYKVYLCDTGLLLGLMDDADPGAIVTSDAFANNGIILKNAVAMTLVKKGYPLYYFAKENSTAEVDFILNQEHITLIEVKSRKYKRSRSLNQVLSEKPEGRKEYKIYEGNVSTDVKGVIHLPLYSASFLKESSVSNIPPVGEFKDPRIKD